MTLQKLAEEIRGINEANGWNITREADWQESEYKVPAIVALIHSEASEALEAFRHDDLDNFLEEMADVVIRALDCVSAFTDDFDGVVAEKLQRNRRRGYRHGGKRV